MTGQEKFDACRHRSSEKYAIEGASFGNCCGASRSNKEGYFCIKKGIEDVNPDLCGVCDSFRTRELFQEILDNASEEKR
jgi:hypothetical protein